MSACGTSAARVLFTTDLGSYDEAGVDPASTTVCYSAWPCRLAYAFVAIRDPEAQTAMSQAQYAFSEAVRIALDGPEQRDLVDLTRSDR
jgi:hypothetical protein